MSPALSAAELLRSIGLDVDGPTRWGAKPTSRQSGIFAIELPEPSEHCNIDIDEVRRWLERVPELKMDGERPTQSTLAERMRSFWIPGQQLVYVGRTAKSLSARVASLYATELGHAQPHPGGHWLKVLRERDQLRLWWAETDAPEEYEDVLIEAFAEHVPEEVRVGLPEGAPLLPWANLESPTTPPRETGLTDALLAVESTPAKASAVKRSDSSGRRRTASRTSSSSRSPRRTATKPVAGNNAAATAPKGPRKDAPTPVTAEGLAAMQSEMRQLVSVERPEVVARVAAARELGDLRENADYEAARNEQSFLEGRIMELEQKIRTAVVIESQAGGAITMGSTVVYEIDGQREELKIVGSAESDPAVGKISSASPVGKSLIGHRAGDDVNVATPVAQFTYRIIEVK
ncbi:MAG: transcription elongation factor GreA [Candidatus Limnocylindrales bacterium]